RERSASFYTPEVLTHCVVEHSLAELLTEDTRAEDILEFRVCEAFNPTWIQNGGTVALAA
ncbi:MAG: hypothetical protein LKI74_04945, partial [Actinomyces sp.]